MPLLLPLFPHVVVVLGGDVVVGASVVVTGTEVAGTVVAGTEIVEDPSPDVLEASAGAEVPGAAFDDVGANGPRSGVVARVPSSAAGSAPGDPGGADVEPGAASAVVVVRSNMVDGDDPEPDTERSTAGFGGTVRVVSEPPSAIMAPTPMPTAATNHTNGRASEATVAPSPVGVAALAAATADDRMAVPGATASVRATSTSRRPTASWPGTVRPAAAASRTRALVS